jgi:hypothetical protein
MFCAVTRLVLTNVNSVYCDYFIIQMDYLYDECMQRIIHIILTKYANTYGFFMRSPIVFIAY